MAEQGWLHPQQQALRKLMMQLSLEDKEDCDVEVPNSYASDIDKLQQMMKTRWLQPQEVVKILQNHKLFTVSHMPPQKPQNGSWFLFNHRLSRYFRSDGFEWQKKKDGRTVKEAHEYLKVDNVDALHCYYACGDKNPTFQRRIYRMMDPAFEYIVLVHYRDIAHSQHYRDVVKVMQTSIQGLYTETVHEDSSCMENDMELNKLERIVNESEEPDALDLSLLHSITENFSEKKKIGSGGCGIVYKGILRNGVVAVKRLHNSRTIKDKMFHREVISLISVKHQNIVRFLGYCSFTKELAMPYEGRTIMVDIRERLLCFEYIRGSLDKHLSDELRGLEWQTRYQIIIGICRGLHYLHKDKEIIHMDLKPGNILLDDLMVPKITDFGLSRPISDSHATTTLLISQGYVAPEYISRGKATSKSDIYSLGIIIIELVTGSRMKPNIVEVLRRWNHRWLKSMKQSSLGYQQVAKCLELALRCIQDDPTARPDISYIIDELKEIDTIDEQTQIEISPCCLEDILGIEPLEIHIPFEDLKISHSIELNNDTDDYIAFVTKAKLECFCTEPNRGIVPPRSKCSVTLAAEARINARPNEHFTEVISVLSNRVDDEALAAMGIVRVGDNMSIDNEEGKVVDEVNVMVVFGRPQLPEE